MSVIKTNFQLIIENCNFQNCKNINEGGSLYFEVNTCLLVLQRNSFIDSSSAKNAHILYTKSRYASSCYVDFSMSYLESCGNAYPNISNLITANNATFNNKDSNQTNCRLTACVNSIGALSSNVQYSRNFFSKCKQHSILFIATISVSSFSSCVFINNEYIKGFDYYFGVVSCDDSMVTFSQCLFCDDETPVTIHDTGKVYFISCYSKTQPTPYIQKSRLILDMTLLPDPILIDIPKIPFSTDDDFQGGLSSPAANINFKLTGTIHNTTGAQIVYSTPWVAAFLIDGVIMIRPDPASDAAKVIWSDRTVC